MKKRISFLMLLMLLLALASAKNGFEYAGTTLFLENQQYQDGYDNKGNQLTGVNKYFTQRVYLDGYYHFNDNNKFRLTLDINGYQKGTNGYDYENSWLFVKYAYLESKNLWGFDKVKFGQVDTPWIGWEDKLWGKRFMAKSILDEHKITNSADRGISLAKKLGDSELTVAVVGGEGYKVRDLDNRYNIEGRYTYNLTKKLSASIGGGSGYKALAGETKVFSQQDWDEVKQQDYTVANIAFVDKGNLVLSFTAYDEVQQKDAGLDGGYINRNAGASATLVRTCLFNKNLDWVFRLDTKAPKYTSAEAADHRKTQTSLVGASYKLNKNIMLAYSNLAVTNEYGDYSRSPAHTHFLQAEIKF